MTTDVKITALHMMTTGRMNQAGLKPVAFFTFEANWFWVRGAQLMADAKGGLNVWLPCFQTGKSLGGSRIRAWGSKTFRPKDRRDAGGGERRHCCRTEFAVRLERRSDVEFVHEIG